MESRYVIEGVNAHTPMAEAAPRLLLAKAKPLFELEARARAGADADAVHDMRVASRRLREAMRLVEPLYPRKPFRAWYRSVRAITRALGPVRDADVFIEAFMRMEPELDEAGRRAVTFFVGYRMGQREYELRALNERLAALDLKASRRELKSLVNHMARSDWLERPFGDFAQAEVVKRVAVVTQAQPAALGKAAHDRQHELRIDYKRLRYALETFAPCYEERFDELHALLTSFQDSLGELHDLHVFLGMVHDAQRAEAARLAGVSAEGLVEVEALLDSRAAERFAAFERLAQEHPPHVLRAALELPAAG